MSASIFYTDNAPISDAYYASISVYNNLNKIKKRTFLSFFFRINDKACGENAYCNFQKTKKKKTYFDYNLCHFLRFFHSNIPKLIT